MMRSKEDMECYKWHKNDRICWLCPYEEECKYEHELHKFADKLYCACEYRPMFHDHYFPSCNNPEVESKYCSGMGEFRCDVVFECKTQEIENWKRKYKLKKLND